MNTPWDNVVMFEQLVADYAGSKYAVATDSCSNAIFLSLMYCRQTGRYTSAQPVTVPSRTYISVPMQVKHAGYTVNFQDIDWSGLYTLDPTPVVDCAQRFTENMYRPGTLQCVSFHSKKILSIGRGGMILTDDSVARDWLIRARYDGRKSIYYNDISDDSDMILGWHMYMTPEQAVRGIEQFYKTPKINKDSGCSKDYAVDLSRISVLK